MEAGKAGLRPLGGTEVSACCSQRCIGGPNPPPPWGAAPRVQGGKGGRGLHFRFGCGQLGASEQTRGLQPQMRVKNNLERQRENIGSKCPKRVSLPIFSLANMCKTHHRAWDDRCASELMMIRNRHFPPPSLQHEGWVWTKAFRPFRRDSLINQKPTPPQKVPGRGGGGGGLISRPKHYPSTPRPPIVFIG